MIHTYRQGVRTWCRVRSMQHSNMPTGTGPTRGLLHPGRSGNRTPDESLSRRPRLTCCDRSTHHRWDTCRSGGPCHRSREGTALQRGRRSSGRFDRSARRWILPVQEVLSPSLRIRYRPSSRQLEMEMRAASLPRMAHHTSEPGSAHQRPRD